jgi:hypothetical protein
MIYRKSQAKLKLKKQLDDKKPEKTIVIHGKIATFNNSN